MKRVISFFMIICMITGLVGLMPEKAAAAEQNVNVPNGNLDKCVSIFESDKPANWQITSEPGEDTDIKLGGNIFSSNRYLQISRKAAVSSYSYFETTITLEPYGIYEVSWEYWGRSGALQVYPMILDLNTDHSDRYYYYQEGTAYGVTDNYVQKTVRFAAGDWTKVNLRFLITGETGACQIDNIACKRLDEEAAFDNWGFSQGTEGWRTAGAEGTISQEQYHDGSSSLYVSFDNPTAITAVTPKAWIPVNGSKNYILRAYVKSRNAENAKIRIDGFVTDKNGSDEALEGVTYMLNADSAMPGWTTVDLRLGPYEETDTVRYLFPKLILTQGSGEVWLDDFRLIPEEEAYKTEFLLCEDQKPDGFSGQGNASFVNGSAILTGAGDSVTGRWNNVRVNNIYRLTVTAQNEVTAAVRFLQDDGMVISAVSKSGSGSFDISFQAPSCAYAQLCFTSETEAVVTGARITLVQKMGSAIPTPGTASITPTEELPVSEICKDENGKPAIYFNGEKLIPSIYLGGEWEYDYGVEYGQKLSDAGMDIVALPLYLDGTSMSAGVWTAEDVYDFTVFDKIVYQALAGMENAKLILQVNANPPDWWLEAHPEARCISHDSAGNPVGEQKVSYASTVWREAICKAARAFVEHVNQSDYAGQVVGTRLTAGPTYEWQYFGVALGQAADFSQASRDGFRQWLRDTYQSDAALRAAWQNDTVTLDTAQVPEFSERVNGDSTILGAAQRNAVDYELYLCDSGTDALLEFADAIKEASNDRWIVGVYNGYVTPVYSYEALGTVHMSIDRILASDSVDFICAPYNYLQRQNGMAAGYMTMVDSIHQAGKLFIMECDNRTSLFDYRNDYGSSLSQTEVAGWGQVYTMTETLDQMKRDFANVITHGAGLWWYGMIGVWFDDDQIYSLMRTCNAEMAAAMEEPRQKNDVAWIVDEDMFAYTSFNFGSSHQWLQRALPEQLQSLATMGCGYDMYYMSSLERETAAGWRPGYKVYVVTGVDFDDNERQVIKEFLMAGGSTVIFSGPAGIGNRDTNTYSEENMEDILGMDITLDESRPYAFAVESSAYGIYGDTSCYFTRPIAYVSGGADEILGSLYEHPEKAGLARKQLSDCTIIYSAAGPVPAELLREAVGSDEIYDSNKSDVVFSGNGYLGINAAFGGERTLKLGGTYHVYNVFRGTYEGRSVSSITVNLRQGETVLYRLEESEHIYDETFSGFIGGCGLNGWSLNDNRTGDLYTVTEDEEQGRVLAMVKGPTARLGSGYVTLSSPIVPVEPGKTYELSFRVKAGSFGDRYNIDGYFFSNSSWNPVRVPQTLWSSTYARSLTTAWQTRNVLITAPEEEVYDTFQIRIRFDGRAGDVMYLDDVTLTEVESGENVVTDGDMENMAGGKPGEWTWNNGTVSLGDWTVEGGIVTAYTEKAYGSYALGLTGILGQEVYATSKEFETGDKNVIRICGSYLAGGNALVKLIVTDPDGVITEHWLNPDDPGEGEAYKKGGGWIMFEKTVQAPCNSTFRLACGTGNIESIAYDNLGISLSEQQILGDAIGNLKVDIRDVVRLKRHLDGQEVFVKKNNSDMDGSGLLDQTDVILLRKFLIGGIK